MKFDVLTCFRISIFLSIIQNYDCYYISIPFPKLIPVLSYHQVFFNVKNNIILIVFKQCDVSLCVVFLNTILFEFRSIWARFVSDVWWMMSCFYYHDDFCIIYEVFEYKRLPVWLHINIIHQNGGKMLILVWGSPQVNAIVIHVVCCCFMQFIIIIKSLSYDLLSAMWRICFKKVNINDTVPCKILLLTWKCWACCLPRATMLSIKGDDSRSYQ